MMKFECGTSVRDENEWLGSGIVCPNQGVCFVGLERSRIDECDRGDVSDHDRVFGPVAISQRQNVVFSFSYDAFPPAVFGAGMNKNHVADADCVPAAR